MENIKRACALGGVSVQATPVEPRTTQSVPFMQMAERTDSKIVTRRDNHVEVTALKFNGMLDSLEKFMDTLSKLEMFSGAKKSFVPPPSCGPASCFIMRSVSCDDLLS